MATVRPGTREEASLAEDHVPSPNREPLAAEVTILSCAKALCSLYSDFTALLHGGGSRAG
jgi:hypothetical protein